MAVKKDLQKRLEELEQEQQRQQEEVGELKVVIEPLEKILERNTGVELPKQAAPIADINLTTVEVIGGEPVPKPSSKEGYVIRLEFGAGAPTSEWSEDTHGWRTKGLGTRYATLTLAEKKLAELKKMWPDYPLKIK